MRLSVASALLGFSVASLGVAAEDQQPQGTPPTAEAVVDRFIEVTGGRDAWDALESLRGLGRLEVVGAKVSGQLALYQTRTGFRMSVDAGGGAGQVTIRNGDRGWSVRPDGVVEEITGAKLQKLLRDRTFNPLMEASTLYESMTVAGVEDVAGAPAWRVTCVPADDVEAEELRFFDVASGLQVKVVERASGAAGAIPTEIYLTDYRAVGAVQLAFGTRIGVGRSSVQISIDAMQANGDVPDCMFEPPAGPIERAVPVQESAQDTLEAFVTVDVASLSESAAKQWVRRLDKAIKAIDPAHPKAESLRSAFIQFRTLCANRVREFTQ